MEEKGHIQIKFTSETKSLSPEDIDINEVKELISDVETFLYPTRKEKISRPHISYQLEKGSAVHKFQLPIADVILFNGLIQEISDRKDVKFLSYSRQLVIDNFQSLARKAGYVIEFLSSLSHSATLTINRATSFQKASQSFYESEFYLYGEIYQEGGKSPNIHLFSSEYGNLTISATKEQIMDGEKKTYKPYGVKVRGKKNLDDNTLADLVLVDFIDFNPIFNRKRLDDVIKKASANLGKITNVDTWIDEVKAQGI